MKYQIGEIIETDSKYSDMVDSTMYSLIANKMAKFTDNYMLLHIQKPKWCPKWLYNLFIKNFVNIAHFK